MLKEDFSRWDYSHGDVLANGLSSVWFVEYILRQLPTALMRRISYSFREFWVERPVLMTSEQQTDHRTTGTRVVHLNSNRSEGGDARSKPRKCGSSRPIRHLHWSYACIALVILLFPSFVGSVRAQSSTASNMQFTAWRATVKPSIDGVWEQNEWDDAAEYSFLIQRSVSNNGQAWARMKHDDIMFYLLIDFVSDYGNGSVHELEGIAFDVKNKGPAFIMISTLSDPAIGLQALKGYGSSPHSQTEHGIVELEISLGAILSANTTTSQDGSPLTDINLFLRDSFGNSLLLAGQIIIERTIATSENLTAIFPIMILISASFCLLNRKRANSRAKSIQ